jgi:hypothetical protein
MLVIAFVLMAVAFTVLAILIAGESAGGTPPCTTGDHGMAKRAKERPAHLASITGEDAQDNHASGLPRAVTLVSAQLFSLVSDQAIATRTADGTKCGCRNVRYGAALGTVSGSKRRSRKRRD